MTGSIQHECSQATQSTISWNEIHYINNGMATNPAAQLVAMQQGGGNTGGIR
ncbi:hypothetical protein [Xanthomonas tesorieronis]|uniref:hypothetical protein n=1 Tax=Xanthomonas tesorieronis TaxID=3160839 RepID=UPI0035119BFE